MILDKFAMDPYNNDIFYDIGHGTGKTVLHAAVDSRCKSIGIEFNDLYYQHSEMLLNAMKNENADLA